MSFGMSKTSRKLVCSLWRPHARWSVVFRKIVGRSYLYATCRETIKITNLLKGLCPAVDCDKLMIISFLKPYRVYCTLSFQNISKCASAWRTCSCNASCGATRSCGAWRGRAARARGTCRRRRCRTWRPRSACASAPAPRAPSRPASRSRSPLAPPRWIKLAGIQIVLQFFIMFSPSMVVYGPNRTVVAQDREMWKRGGNAFAKQWDIT